MQLRMQMRMILSEGCRVDINIFPANREKLSFGQRQRIAIARAFLKNAPIILFDGVVSGLDYEPERAICEAVSVLIKEKTAIIITHRDADAWHAKKKINMPNVS